MVERIDEEHPLQSVADFSSFPSINLSMFRGVLIDLDNTLYSYDPAHRVGLRAAFEAAGDWGAFDPFAAEYRAARDAVTARLKGQGSCRSRLFAFQSMCEARGVAHPYVLARELAKTYWRAFVAAMRPDPDAVEFLRRCRSDQIPVCVVTDMTAEIQIDKILSLGLIDLIPHLVTSEEVGAEKPDPRMFEAGLAKIGVQANEAVMVGDDLKKDVLGASAIGVRTAMITLGASPF